MSSGKARDQGILNVSFHFLALTPRFSTFFMRLAVDGVSVKNPSAQKGGSYPCKKSSSNHHSGQIVLKVYTLVLEMICQNSKIHF